jgi:hypothetical protein
MADDQQEAVMVQKSAEELKKQQERDAKERERDAKEREQFIANHVPKLAIEGLDKAGLDKKVRSLHESITRLEEEKYDWELKLRKMDFEINELNIVVNDIKGHYVKPPLKKISKTEQKLAKIAEVKSKLGSAFRENLKSTGQSKFAVEEKDESGKKPEWGQDGLKAKKEKEGGAEEAAADEEEEEEEEEE